MPMPRPSFTFQLRQKKTFLLSLYYSCLSARCLTALKKYLRKSLNTRSNGSQPGEWWWCACILNHITANNSHSDNRNGRLLQYLYCTHTRRQSAVANRILFIRRAWASSVRPYTLSILWWKALFDGQTSNSKFMLITTFKNAHHLTSALPNPRTVSKTRRSPSLFDD